MKTSNNKQKQFKKLHKMHQNSIFGGVDKRDIVRPGEQGNKK